MCSKYEPLCAASTSRPAECGPSRSRFVLPVRVDLRNVLQVRASLCCKYESACGMWPEQELVCAASTTRPCGMCSKYEPVCAASTNRPAGCAPGTSRLVLPVRAVLRNVAKHELICAPSTSHSPECAWMSRSCPPLPYRLHAPGHSDIGV